jgi:hypothetical protein
MQTRLEAVEARLAAVEQWLAAGEQRLGTGPDTADLDEQTGQVCREKESAIGAKDYEQAAALRNREKELLAAKAARQEQWAARHLELPDLAERVQAAHRRGRAAPRSAPPARHRHARQASLT